MRDSSGPARSTSVTVLACLLIALSAFSTVIAVLQNRPDTMTRYSEAMDRAIQDSTFATAAPSAWVFVFANFRTLALLGLAASAAMLVASVGLLRRRNWARVAIVLLFALGIASVVGLLFVQDAMMPDFTAIFAQDSTLRQARDDLAAVSRTMRAFMLVLVLGVVGLCGWSIAKLLSPAVRAEFAPPEHAD
jgi:hypothetical protein